MTTRNSLDMSAWLALSLCLANASALPAMAEGMDNPVLNFAFSLSYYGLPVCLVLLVVLLILKQLKNKKLRDAAANGPSGTASGTDVGNAATASDSGTDAGNAVIANSESSSQEPVKEEKSSL
jgi:hypothetical protein